MEHIGGSDSESYALSPVGVDYLKQCVGEDPDTYVKEAVRFPVPELFIAASAARVFDGPNTSRGNYLASDDARIFLAGEILGLELADNYLTADARAGVLDELRRLPNPVGFMPIERKLDIARADIMQKGSGGWLLAETSFGSLFDYWQSALGSTDVDRQEDDRLMLHCGFGLVVGLMEESRAREMERIYSVEFSEGRLDDYLQSILEAGA